MSGPQHQKQIAIIGAGITGLSAALRLGELSTGGETTLRAEVSVFDVASRVGGVLHTERIGDYLVERAADMWITNKPEGVRLCEKLGLGERLIPTDAQFRRSLVLRSGRIHAVPEGFQLMVPEQAWPLLRSPVLSWRGKLRLMCEPLIPARRDGAEESLAEFVIRRCGREAFDRLIQPLVGGIYTADPHKLSLKSTLPRFIEMEQAHGSLIRAAWRESRRRSQQPASDSNRDAPGTSGARYGLFVSLPGGVGELLDAMVRRVSESARLRLNTAVRSIRAESPQRFALTLASGETERFDAVILAVPSFVAARLLVDSADELASELNRIEYASTVVVVSGHQLTDIQHPLNAFGLVIPHIERRKILAVSFTSRKFAGRAPAGRVLLRTFVGGALQPELCELDDAELLKLVRRELHELLGVGGEPDFAVAVRHTRAMPQYHVGHAETVARIQSLVERTPGLAVAGNYLSGVGIPDSIASSESAANSVLRAISQPTPST